MIAKPHGAATAFQYRPEDLKPHDTKAEEASADAFLERNAEAINGSIDEADAEFERGAFATDDQVQAEIEGRRRRRTGSV